MPAPDIGATALAPGNVPTSVGASAIVSATKGGGRRPYSKKAGKKGPGPVPGSATKTVQNSMNSSA